MKRHRLTLPDEIRAAAIVRESTVVVEVGGGPHGIDRVNYKPGLSDDSVAEVVGGGCTRANIQRIRMACVGVLHRPRKKSAALTDQVATLSAELKDMKSVVDELYGWGQKTDKLVKHMAARLEVRFKANGQGEVSLVGGQQPHA